MPCPMRLGPEPRISTFGFPVCGAISDSAAGSVS